MYMCVCARGGWVPNEDEGEGEGGGRSRCRDSTHRTCTCKIDPKSVRATCTCAAAAFEVLDGYSTGTQAVLKGTRRTLKASSRLPGYCRVRAGAALLFDWVASNARLRHHALALLLPADPHTARAVADPPGTVTLCGTHRGWLLSAKVLALAEQTLRGRCTRSAPAAVGATERCWAAWCMLWIAQCRSRHVAVRRTSSCQARISARGGTGPSATVRTMPYCVAPRCLWMPGGCRHTSPMCPSA